MSAWRKEPPTVAEVQACPWWWSRFGGEEYLARLAVRDGRIAEVAPEDRACVIGFIEDAAPGCEWSPCAPPSDAPAGDVREAMTWQNERDPHEPEAKKACARCGHMIGGRAFSGIGDGRVVHVYTLDCGVHPLAAPPPRDREAIGRGFDGLKQPHVSMSGECAALIRQHVEPCDGWQDCACPFGECDCDAPKQHAAVEALRKLVGA